jgi:hypothetical protein
MNDSTRLTFVSFGMLVDEKIIDHIRVVVRSLIEVVDENVRTYIEMSHVAVLRH